MSRQQPETILLGHIRDALHKLPNTKVIKIHGNAYTEMGTPDLLGSCMGQCIAIEVKVPGEDPALIQILRLDQWALTGARVGVAHSIDEALDIVTGGNPWKLSRDYGNIK